MVVEGLPSETWNLEERMRQFSVPAFSVAVIDEGELAWARSWGVIEAGGERPVTTETIFQAGSVSKPIAALLALTIVRDGELALDQPVNEVLKSWKVPDNEFTRQQPVTLRHILAHQAGFTPAGYLIPRDGSPVPGMAEILKGGIRDWPAITVEFLPGSRRAYSNAGYCVLQLMLEDLSGANLHRLAAKRLFGPLNMSRSTFGEPLTPEVLETAATGHVRKSAGEGKSRKAEPVEGKAQIAPAATGGLWSTATDLAHWAVEVMRGWRGEDNGVVSTAVARQFLTPQVENEGLGIHLRGKGPALRAQHGGQMVGFICHLVFYPNTGQGAVMMSNSDGGRWLHREIEAAIAAEYGWPDLPVRRTLGSATPEQLRDLAGVYTLDMSPKTTFTVTIEGDTASGQINQYPPFELTPTTEADLYILPRESMEILFSRNADGTVDAVKLGRAGNAGNRYSRKTE
jgi:CubicO group peptidase (beta-lactamase class C family)